ncbi:hypothetical protein ACQ4PT_060741 [Festuca glaucescens]
MASTVSSARPADLRQKLAEMSRADLVAGLSHVKDQAAAAVSTRDGAMKASALVLGGAVSIYFLWPAAAAPAAAGAMMKAPGAAGFVVSAWRSWPTSSSISRSSARPALPLRSRFSRCRELGIDGSDVRMCTRVRTSHLRCVQPVLGAVC